MSAFTKPTLRTGFVLGFFALAVILGVIIHGDYGISADEPQMYSFGVQVYAYLFMGGPEPTMFDWSFHNPVIHIVMAAVQRWLSLETAQSVWFSRHLINYLFFLTGVWAFYRIALRLLKDNWKLALLGCMFFLLSPRIFAHAFYNPKDLPALVLFTVSMATLLAARENGYSWKWLLLHALACALSISVRTSGLLVPVLTILALILDVALSGGMRSREGIRYFLIRSASFTAAVVLLLIAVWPRLWSDPIGNFVMAFSDSASRSGGGLYMGQMLSTVTPWHYVPVWIAITTPLLYTALFLCGLVGMASDAAKRRLDFVRSFADQLLILAWFAAPLAAIVVLRIGIFDEWRHVFFVYPAFLLIALLGAERLLRTSRVIVQRIVIGLIAVCSLWTAGWMIVNHPRQYAYFSVPSSWVEGNFELDYWSLSYYQGLAWVLEHDDRDAIPVYTAARVGYVSADLFPRDQWERFRFVSASSASYILDNFRWNEYQKVLPDDRALYTVSTDGLDLLTVYAGGDDGELYPQHTE